jgi:hypothetical protein
MARSVVAPDLRISPTIGSLAAARSAPASIASIALARAASIFGLPSLTPLALGAVALGTFAYDVERIFGVNRGSVLTGGMPVGQYCAIGATISVGTLLLGVGGTNSQYQRGVVLRTLAGFATATILASPPWLQPPRRLAERS